MNNGIKRIREEKGISQQKCAEELGISIRTLQRYEKGETENLTYFVRIAEYLDVSLEELLKKDK